MLLQHVDEDNEDTICSFKNVSLIEYLSPVSSLTSHLLSIILFYSQYETLKLHVIAAISIRAFDTFETHN